MAGPAVGVDAGCPRCRGRTLIQATATRGKVRTGFPYLATLWLALSLASCAEEGVGPDVESPGLRILSPTAHSILFNQRDTVRLEATDNVSVSEVEVFVARRALEKIPGPGWSFLWETGSESDGVYVLDARASDEAGNVATDRVSVELVSLLIVSEIQVTGVTDSGALEIEVHLFDGGTFLGCAGQSSGLESVDQSDTLYRVGAVFRKPPDGEGLLTVEEVAGRRLYLQVIEDDTGPCPARPALGQVFASDALVGFANFTVPATLETQVVPVEGFDGGVTRLVFARGRRK